MIVQICVGSACHIKGSADIISMMQEAVEVNKLEGDVILAGNFCTGKCNREGVTITIDDEVYTGITKETFKDFFENKILNVVKGA